VVKKDELKLLGASQAKRKNYLKKTINHVNVHSGEADMIQKQGRDKAAKGSEVSHQNSLSSIRLLGFFCLSSRRWLFFFSLHCSLYFFGIIATKVHLLASVGFVVLGVLQRRGEGERGDYVSS
jgi:hypothetical protein